MREHPHYNPPSEESVDRLKKIRKERTETRQLIIDAVCCVVIFILSALVVCSHQNADTWQRHRSLRRVFFDVPSYKQVVVLLNM